MGVKFTAVLLLAALFGASTAQECTIACPRSLPTTVVPKIDSTYVYSLEAKTLLNARDTQKVTIKADAEVSINSVCESSLRLKNVAIDGVTGGDALSAELSANPAGFGYMNGRIYGFCPAKGESDWAANIKRAVISALQVSASGEDSIQVEESDFSGDCPARYSPVEKKGDEITMSKKKDLNACSNRRIDLRLQANQALAQFKELLRHYVHPLDSRSTCKITLKDKTVNFVECEETHTLSHRPSKPIQISNMKLSLKEVKAGVGAFNEKPLEMQKIYVGYEHSHKHDATEADVVAVLKKICQAVSDQTSDIETSTFFSDLVGKLRYLSEDATVSVDEAVKSGSICSTAPKRLRELFLDASAFAASDPSIKTLVKAHDAKELSISRAAAAFTVVALKAAPKEETVRALLPIIKSSEVTRPMLLGFSVLARRYCEKTDNCKSNEAIKEARDAYLSEIGKTQDHLKKITMIKALENLNLNKDGDDAVNKMLEETIKSDAETGCKVAAVNAIIDDASMAGKLKEIIMKETNPNEVRIAAFQKLVQNNGLKDAKEVMTVQDSCVKNYILSYIKNLKNSMIPDRKSMAAGIDLPEEPKKEIGVSKNIIYEYGPYTIEMDVIYPKDSNVTRALGARVIRNVDGKFKEVAEVTIRQEGFDEQVGNVLKLATRKIRPDQFGMEAVKHLTNMLTEFKKKDKNHHHLQISGKINGKNIFFTDAFEDIHTLMELITARIEKVMQDKKLDRTIGGVLIDTKVVVPTISGLPLIYKLEDNFVLQVNGMAEKNGDKKRYVLNRSLIAGIHASVKLQLKDNKMGYEYDAKLAVTPHIDVEVESKDNKFKLTFDTKNEKQKLIKFKQSLKEVKKDANADEQENELAAEPRSENCFQMMIMNYCRKASQVKGLIFPNLEYYMMKPEAGINAVTVEFDWGSVKDGPRHFGVKIDAVGGTRPYEHLGKVEINYPKNGPKDVLFLLKSPDNKFETKFSANLDDTANMELKLDLPHLINVNLKNKYEKDKEKGSMKNNVLVEYTFPGDSTKHTIKFQNSLTSTWKRNAKDKIATFEYSSNFESSRRPFLNHRKLISIKYRPYKVNDVILEFAYGQDMKNLYKFSRLSKIDVQEFRPHKMTSESDIVLIATDLDVHYEMKANTRFLNDKSSGMEFDLNANGKDLSKRHASGNNEITSKIEYRFKKAGFNSKLDANLNLRGREMSWNSDFKEVEKEKYEGKITIQTEKDKKIFINHKNQLSRPVKEMSLHSEAEITYSYKPDKKSYKFDVKQTEQNFLITGEATKDGKVIFSNDINFENKSGKLKAKLARDVRSYDLTVDNVFRPKEAKLIFKIEDRVYDIDMKREPLKFMNLKVTGNDKALIQKGDAHLSLVDPSTFNLLTKANTKIELLMDVFTMDKKMAAKIDSPKFNFVHDGEIEISMLNRRILHKSYTKINGKEYKYNADVARKGSLITLEVIKPERTSNIKYSRQGDKIKIDLDTSFLQGKIEGDPKSGKIILKNAQKNYELESNYKHENGKLIIESVSSNNAKLEAVISRHEASKLILETPETKANLQMNFATPIKTMKFNFENPKYTKKIDAEFEPGKKFRYDSVGKTIPDNKEMKVLIEGIPMKELKANLDYPDFKFKVDQISGTNKVKFSYTFNNYTEDEEFDFDPNKAYFVNWISAVRQYGQTFIVQN